MKEILKKIRKHTGLSQQEMANEMDVSFATVNRWENGRATPNRLAQISLYEFCKRRDVPVYEMMMEQIRRKTGSIPGCEGRVLLYHGSKSGIEGEIAPLSRPRCDFGKGFYMGTDIMQSLTLTCDYEDSRAYILSLDMKDLVCLEFTEDMDWAMIIAYNRGKMDSIRGSAFHSKYMNRLAETDLAIGGIADDRLFYVLDNYFKGVITDEALVKSLSALKLGKQYVALSQKACDNIRIEKEIDLSYLERMAIKEKAEENRAIGKERADEIARKYRREGEYFDELLNRIKELTI